jgi:hypothetical protein
MPTNFDHTLRRHCLWLSSWYCKNLQHTRATNKCENISGVRGNAHATTSCSLALIPQLGRAPQVKFITTAVTPGPSGILSGPVETEFQGRLKSSYDAGPAGAGECYAQTLSDACLSATMWKARNHSSPFLYSHANLQHLEPSSTFALARVTDDLFQTSCTPHLLDRAEPPCASSSSPFTTFSVSWRKFLWQPRYINNTRHDKIYSDRAHLFSGLKKTEVLATSIV